MNDIFISYSRKDKGIVDTFYDSLIEAGFSVWMDVDGIESGDAFKKKIVQAIDDCSVFIFFSSVHSNESTWTKKEIGVACHKQKRIIPVKLDNSPYCNEILFDFVNLDYIDCTSSKLIENNMGRLIHNLKKVIVRDKTDEYILCPKCHSYELKIKFQNVHLQQNLAITKKNFSLKKTGAIAGAVIAANIFPTLVIPWLIGAGVKKRYFDSGLFKSKESQESIESKEEPQLKESEMPSMVMTCCKCGNVFDISEAKIQGKE